MKILSTKLDTTTISFLQNNGVVVEQEDLEVAEDLDAWLQDDLFDAAIIDLELSGLGIFACRGLRAKNIKTPVVGISSGHNDRSWSDHRAMFLENGGDDLLRGPTNPRELAASLRAIHRRFKGSLLDIATFERPGARLKINLTTRLIEMNDLALDLTGKETALMLLLASGPERVFSKEMLLTGIYTGGVDDEPEMKIIDVFVCKTRNKLDAIHPEGGKFIETVWGRGYRLVNGVVTSKEVA